MWTGSSNKILKLSEKRLIKIYASPEMMVEFSDVIKRVKFAKRIHELKTSVTELTVCFLRLIEIIRVKKVKLKLDEKPVDTDDEMFIFCSLSAQAFFLVTGDPHLRILKEVRGVKILNPHEFMHEFKSSKPYE